MSRTAKSSATPRPGFVKGQPFPKISKPALRKGKVSTKGFPGAK